LGLQNRRTFGRVASLVIVSLVLNGAIVLAGLVVVALITSDVFQSVIVPRPSPFLRASALIIRFAWRACGNIGLRFADNERREGFFGTFAPAALTWLLIFWVATLVIGFGLIFFGLRSQLHPMPASYWGAAYYAGTSLLTLGYGDITASSGIVRAISLAAAAIGLGTFAVVTAFLFALFAAFQRREAFIVTMRERMGAPPSGVSYLWRLVELDMLDDLPETFRLAEGWMADVMETHLAYPVLAYFRSTHDGQSWVATVGALLDAATLVITTVDVEHHGRAKMLSRLGRHLVNDFAHYYRFEIVHSPGLDRAEFVTVYEKLRRHGMKMHDLEPAWTAFAELRATYAGPLNAMAQFWRTPPAQWIGDRSVLPSRHVPLPPTPIAARPEMPDPMPPEPVNR
jgi:hypothetical protein